MRLSYNTIHLQNEKQIKLEDCSLPFGSKLSSYFLSKNLKDKNTQNFKFVALYRHETWSLTLWEEQRLRVYENSALRRKFGPKREEVGSGRRLKKAA
jgi:hypothetical protein